MVEARDKVKGKTRSVWEIVVGVLLVLGGIGGIGSQPLTGLASLFLGAFLIASGIEWKLLARCLRAYSVILSNDPSGSIAAIASATKTPERVVVKNLKLLVKKGLIPDAVVDEQAGRVIVRRASAQPQTVPAQAPAAPPMVVVHCSACGADNDVPKGSAAPCEQCGTKLSA